MSNSPKKVVSVSRTRLVVLAALALALLVALVLLTMFANAPGWLLLYPLLIAALLVVSGLIVIALLRRL